MQSWNVFSERNFDIYLIFIWYLFDIYLIFLFFWPSFLFFLFDRQPKIKVFYSLKENLYGKNENDCLLQVVEVCENLYVNLNWTMKFHPFSEVFPSTQYPIARFECNTIFYHKPINALRSHVDNTLTSTNIS